MTRATEAACKMMREYFGSRGEPSPQDAAEALLDRLRVGAKPQFTDRQYSLARPIMKNAYFDVDDLAENHLGVSLIIERLDHLDVEAGAKVFGFARPIAREITICERATTYEPLYRTTVMHELGHVALHVPDAKCSLNYAPSSSRRPAFEREADRFMVAAVLPDSVLDLAVAVCAYFHGTDVVSALRVANDTRGRWQWRTWFLPMLINHLCVSRQLVLINLQRRGFFTRETVAHHLSYRLETRWHRPGAGCPKLKRSMRRLIECTAVDAPASSFARPGGASPAFASTMARSAACGSR